MTTPKPIVLIVEDDEDSRESLRDLLELEGYRVTTASDGAQALAELDLIGDETCIVLLDLYMPVMDGFEVLDQLRRDGRLARLKVLVTTSATHAAPADVPVLGKPINPDKMLHAVASLC